jgi:hypothetical protein
VSSIKDLLSDIRNLDVVLPEFQREYVWTREQSKQLLVSLYRGYPTGALLFWKTDNPPEIKNSAIDPHDVGTTQVMLDGQQRLTTLYLLTQDAIPPYYAEADIQTDPRNLYFNLDDGDFQYYQSTRMRHNLAWVPVTEAFAAADGLNVFAIAAEKSDDDSGTLRLAQQFSETLNRLRGILERPYPIQTVPSSAGIDEAIDVFDRVNSLGTKLSDAELALAHITGKWPKARQAMKTKMTELEAKRFGFDLTFMVRALTTVATQRALFDLVHKIPRDELEEAWNSLTKILDYMISVLPGQAFIHSTEDFNTTNVLIPLVAFLSKNGGTFDNDVQLKEAIHWLYAASIWARYTSQTDQRLDHDIAIVQRSDRPWPELVDAIIDQRGRIEVKDSDFEGRSIQHPLYRMSRVAIKAQGAVDWFNGAPLAQTYGSAFQIHSHHIFPSSVLYGEAGYSSENHLHSKIVNEIANRAFLTGDSNIALSNTKPAEYLPGVEEQYPGSIAKQFVPVDSELWELDHYERFLAKRRKLLATAINSMLGALLGPAPTVRKRDALSLIGLGESAEVEFKSSLRWDVERSQVNKALEKVVAKTVAGFLNAEGGMLLIGVADDGLVLGIEDDVATLGRKDLDGFEQRLVVVLNNHLGVEFSQFWHLDLHTDDTGSTVALVEVDPSPQPVFLSDGGGKDFYARVGATTQPFDVESATNYINMHWQD